MKIAVVALLVLWVLALMSGATMDGLVHVLPLAAVGLVVYTLVLRSKARSSAQQHSLEVHKSTQEGLLREALATRPRKDQDQQE
jgi:hypothetical protein